MTLMGQKNLVSDLLSLLLMQCPVYTDQEGNYIFNFCGIVQLNIKRFGRLW